MARKRKPLSPTAKRRAALRAAERMGRQYRQLKAARQTEATPVVDPDQIEGVYDTLGEARAALVALRERGLAEDNRRAGFSTGLATGLAIVAVLGVGLVLVYVLFRRRENQPSTATGNALAAPQVVHIVEKPMAVETSTTTTVTRPKYHDQ